MGVSNALGAKQTSKLILFVDFHANRFSTTLVTMLSSFLSFRQKADDDKENATNSATVGNGNKKNGGKSTKTADSGKENTRPSGEATLRLTATDKENIDGGKLKKKSADGGKLKKKSADGGKLKKMTENNRPSGETTLAHLMNTRPARVSLESDPIPRKKNKRKRQPAKPKDDAEFPSPPPAPKE